jgi:hypothetical protein
MRDELQGVVDEFESASVRLRSLARGVKEDIWARRPDPARWSAAECVAHLNLTSAAYLPILADGIERARQLGGAAPRRYRRDLAGWLLWTTMGPPVRFPVQTTAAFVPMGGATLSDLLAEFENRQRQQIAYVQAADGLPLARIKIASPFNARLHYNLYACLTILPRHQHRHLWQAEQACQAVRRQR